MADETAKLQAQYDSLQARLRLAKEGRQQPHSSPDHHYGRQPYRGAGRGRVARSRAFPNKKLVLNEPTPPNHIDTDNTLPTPKQKPSSASTVLRPDRHAADSPAVSSMHTPPVASCAHTSTADGKREITIEGIRFRMKEDGSKLYRVDGEKIDEIGQALQHHELNSPDPLTAALTTPKQVFIAGIEFLRSKSGNLLRKTAINPTARYESNGPPGTVPRSSRIITFRVTQNTKPQCIKFTKNGTCYDGPKCKYTHDPKKVAICKTYFRTGDCADGTRCDLSHKATYERVPACSHFLNGNCTNASCRYAHVNVSPTPLVCRPFATLGFCDKETGECRNFAAGKCKLQHVTRAHLERKARRDDDSEVESEDEENTSGNDIDSDQVAEDVDMTGIDGDSHAISQNQDYIGFD
ncbi:hypothetical protein B0A48_10743 [Cryoendolithus antarcticus]|uniref:C3H1-type domain-containing protein n=1 Tax=Cryoendolithus antarcticus TaxID=1507870 RepID=A0A1V8SYA2_9PEZI|nr:hypothetical protein B0A48_10743 [Cryoendolithus antarcticus]